MNGFFCLAKWNVELINNKIMENDINHVCNILSFSHRSINIAFNGECQTTIGVQF